MQRFSAFDVAELKMVYRILHASLVDNLELMDAVFMEELQKWLQYRAVQDGVDVSDHGSWDAWLGGKVVSCEERVAGRRVLHLVSEETD